MENVVVVEIGDDLSRSQAERDVTRGAGAEASSPDASYPLVVEGGEKCRRRIDTAIVDHHELPIRISLAHDRGDGAFQPIASIAGR